MQLGESLLTAHRRAVVMLGGHIVECIGYGYQPGTHWYVFTPDALGISLAVIPFVVIENQTAGFLEERNFSQQVVAYRRVFPYHLPFFLGEVAGLVQHVIRNAELADIVENSGIFQILLIFPGKRQFSGADESVVGYPARMPSPARLLGIRERYQGADGAPVGMKQVCVHPRGLDGHADGRRHTHHYPQVFPGKIGTVRLIKYLDNTDYFIAEDYRHSDDRLRLETGGVIYHLVEIRVLFSVVNDKRPGVAHYPAGDSRLPADVQALELLSYGTVSELEIQFLGIIVQ